MSSDLPSKRLTCGERVLDLIDNSYMGYRLGSYAIGLGLVATVVLGITVALQVVLRLRAQSYFADWDITTAADTHPLTLAWAQQQQVIMARWANDTGPRTLRADVTREREERDEVDDSTTYTWVARRSVFPVLENATISPVDLTSPNPLYAYYARQTSKDDTVLWTRVLQHEQLIEDVLTYINSPTGMRRELWIDQWTSSPATATETLYAPGLTRVIQAVTQFFADSGPYYDWVNWIRNIGPSSVSLADLVPSTALVGGNVIVGVHTILVRPFQPGVLACQWTGSVQDAYRAYLTGDFSAMGNSACRDVWESPSGLIALDSTLGAAILTLGAAPDVEIAVLTALFTVIPRFSDICLWDDREVRGQIEVILALTDPQWATLRQGICAYMRKWNQRDPVPPDVGLRRFCSGPGSNDVNGTLPFSLPEWSGQQEELGLLDPPERSWTWTMAAFTAATYSASACQEAIQCISRAATVYTFHKDVDLPPPMSACPNVSPSARDALKEFANQHALAFQASALFQWRQTTPGFSAVFNGTSYHRLIHTVFPFSSSQPGLAAFSLVASNPSMPLQRVPGALSRADPAASVTRRNERGPYLYLLNDALLTEPLPAPSFSLRRLTLSQRQALRAWILDSIAASTLDPWTQFFTASVASGCIPGPLCSVFRFFTDPNATVAATDPRPVIWPLLEYAFVEPVTIGNLPTPPPTTLTPLQRQKFTDYLLDAYYVSRLPRTSSPWAVHNPYSWLLGSSPDPWAQRWAAALNQTASFPTPVQIGLLDVNLGPVVAQIRASSLLMFYAAADNQPETSRDQWKDMWTGLIWTETRRERLNDRLTRRTLSTKNACTSTRDDLAQVCECQDRPAFIDMDLQTGWVANTSLCVTYSVVWDSQLRSAFAATPPMGLSSFLDIDTVTTPSTIAQNKYTTKQEQDATLINSTLVPLCIIIAVLYLAAILFAVAWWIRRRRVFAIESRMELVNDPFRERVVDRVTVL